MSNICSRCVRGGDILSIFDVKNIEEKTEEGMRYLFFLGGAGPALGGLKLEKVTKSWKKSQKVTISRRVPKF